MQWINILCKLNVTHKTLSWITTWRKCYMISQDLTNSATEQQMKHHITNASEKSFKPTAWLWNWQSTWQMQGKQENHAMTVINKHTWHQWQPVHWQESRMFLLAEMHRRVLHRICCPSHQNDVSMTRLRSMKDHIQGQISTISRKTAKQLIREQLNVV